MLERYLIGFQDARALIRIAKAAQLHQFPEGECHTKSLPTGEHSISSTPLLETTALVPSMFPFAHERSAYSNPARWK
jgi:hypothetical protein